jgi:hypothetical protein
MAAMPWPRRRTRLIEVQLKQENHALQMVVLNLRRELEDKQGAVGRLELVLRERLTRIDDLNGKLEQARAQNGAWMPRTNT